MPMKLFDIAKDGRCVGSLGLLSPYKCDDTGGAVIFAFYGALRVDLPVYPHRASITNYQAALRIDRSCPPVPCSRMDGPVRYRQRIRYVFSRAALAATPIL